MDQVQEIGSRFAAVNGPGGVHPLPSTRPSPASRPEAGGPSFQDVFKDQLQRRDLNFSAHALDRMQHRNIRLAPQDVERLKSGVDRIAAKGGRESLVFMDRSAFVVSVANRTVITAMTADSMMEKLFTNIDSAVVL